jgi:hypothetical protein
MCVSLVCKHKHTSTISVINARTCIHRESSPTLQTPFELPATAMHSTPLTSILMQPYVSPPLIVIVSVRTVTTLPGCSSSSQSPPAKPPLPTLTSISMQP